MKACIATVRLLIDTDDSDMACDGITAFLNENMQIHTPESSIIDWRYETGGTPVSIDIFEGYIPDKDEIAEHPYMKVRAI